MCSSLKRLCLAFAASVLSVIAANNAAADMIQQYTVKNDGKGGPKPYKYATFGNTAPDPSTIPNETGGSYTDTWSNGSLSAEGQSVYLPGNSTYNNISFSFYTGSVADGSVAPTPYAPTTTTLYVFEVLGNPNVGVNGGPYIGTMATPATPANLSPSTPGVIGYAAGNGTVYNFTNLTLTAGNTYYFYEGTTTPDDTSLAVFSNTTYTPFYNGTSNPNQTPSSKDTYSGDQRYRTGGDGTYLGPNNSMTLFTLSGNVVPEPSRIVGILGVGIMGAFGLCFGVARKRKPAVG